MLKKPPIMLGIFVFLLLLVLIAVAANANASSAHWKMNEERGHVLHDSSGKPQDGHIGKFVRTTGKYHHFAAMPRGVYEPGHVDVVPDRAVLDPGNHPFAVSVRFRWPNGHDNNLIQKGQGSPQGGLFKMKTTVLGGSQPPGHIKCLFRGSTGDSQVESYSGKRLDDGRWHTVLCRRTKTGTVMAVDGVQVDANGNDPGFISNDWPIAIGGNASCDSPDLECNYWHGDIGDIQWMVRR